MHSCRKLFRDSMVPEMKDLIAFFVAAVNGIMSVSKKLSSLCLVMFRVNLEFESQ